MAQDSSKMSVQDIYSSIADEIGLTIADGVAIPAMPRLQFLRRLNRLLGEIGDITTSVERLVLLTPDRRWLRYIKVTPEEDSTGIVRIDLEGQKPTLLDANDPDNLDFQFEDPCTGDGIDPNYGGKKSLVANPTGDVRRDAAPDSFPKIYLPAECNIPIASYGFWEDNNVITSSTYHFPLGNQERIGGSNEPLTPFVVDMRKVGYGSFTVGNEFYPVVADTHRYFIDPFLIGLLRLVQYNVVIGTATDYDIPYSADSYLNDTWATILGMDATSTGNAAMRDPNLNQFTVDGVTYTVTINSAPYNVPLDTAFAVDITDGIYTWTYTITPSETPWTTVGTNCDKWGNLFRGQSLYSNRGYYVKVNDFVLRLPDDYLMAKWVWKIPTSSLFLDLPEDPTEDYVTTALSDMESLQYSRLDDAYHYFPVTESKFTQLKYLETEGYDFRGEGFYIQKGQQFRITPRPDDLKSAVIAMLYDAKPDNVPLDTAMVDFDTTFLELPSEAVNVIIYMFLASYHMSARSKDFDAANLYERKAAMALNKLEKLYGGRQGQQGDAPVVSQTYDPGAYYRSFGFNRTRRGGGSRYGET
jgi:hypothetical protein